MRSKVVSKESFDKRIPGEESDMNAVEVGIEVSHPRVCEKSSGTYRFEVSASRLKSRGKGLTSVLRSESERMKRTEQAQTQESFAQSNPFVPRDGIAGMK